MSLLEYQRLSRQQQKQRHVITTYKNDVECLKNDCTTFQQLLKKSKQDNQQLKLQIHQLKKDKQNLVFEIQQTQSRYFIVLGKLQEQLEQRKKKYNKLESKIAPLVDYDSVRLKILTQIQYQHGMEIENYKISIETLKDNILKLRRQNQFLKHKFETYKMDHEQQIRKLRRASENSNKKQSLETINYQINKEIEHSLKNNYEQARKQAQYYKQRYFNSQKRYQQKIIHLEKDIQRIQTQQFSSKLY